MVAPANLRHDARRLIVAAWLFAGLVLANTVLTSDTLEASCGDYLLHEPANATAIGGPPHRNLAIDVLSNRHAMRTDPLPESPTSPCAGGRCQSAPPHPPANSSTCGVYVKQPVVLDSFASLDSDPDARDWRYPADGLRPEGRWIAVDLPPPKA